MTNTIWSITQLVGYVKNKLTFDSNLRNVKVQGELGNFSSYRGSGHWYFTLKDAGASIKCAMFKGYNNAVEFNPEEGDTVIVTGTVNVYENRGELQLVVTEMKLAGQGMFYIQFEKTRKKLEPLGYFEESRKKKICPYPTSIAVVTGANTAALQDIRITVSRRWPLAKLNEVYAVVQGKEAIESVVNALKKADETNSDTIILARGGGSVDDLWCFNDEKIARAIYECRTPVITGIGHEIDVTIADLVADVRAATPTAAATFATPDQQEVRNRISNYRSIMRTVLENDLSSLYQNLDYMNMKLDAFADRFNQQKMKLDNYMSIIYLAMSKNMDRYADDVKRECEYMQKAIENRIQRNSDDLATDRRMLDGSAQSFLDRKKYEFVNSINLLDSLSPLKTLQRGYSVASQNDRVIRSVRDVDYDSNMTVTLADGKIDCKPLGGHDNG